VKGGGMAVIFSFPQTEPTPLLGRMVELEMIIQRLVRDHVRLLSLTGPAGVGKTRLALETRDRLAHQFPDGVTLVDLTPVRDPSLVLPTIAQALDLIDSGPRPLLDRLQEYLRDREVLLILDNFEQVLPAAEGLAAMLAGAPGLRILATSRVPLHLRWEQTLRIVPLPVPDLDAILPLDDLVQIPSVALFVERAQAQRGDFAPTEQQAPLLVQMVRQLDGLPLAIELAAAHMNVLPLAVIAQRLDQHLQTLQWDAYDLPDRQRSLHAAIGWSYDLLTEQERRLFCYLGVFVGRVSLNAIEAVTGAGDDEQTLAAMVSLAEKSLVLPGQPEDEDPEPSFGMLETVRQYAYEQLELNGELENAGRAHAGYFLDLAERAEPELRQRGQMVWYRRLASEHDNLRVALRWLLDHEESERALRLAGALGYFWWTRGSNAEDWRSLEEALTRAAQTAPAIRARGLNALAIHLLSQGELERARPILDEALELSRSLDDWSSVAQSLTGLGLVAQRRGEWEESARCLDDARRYAREAEDAAGITYTLVHRGITTLFEGDEEAAEQLLREAEAAYTGLSDVRNVVTTRAWLAYLAGRRGDLSHTAEQLQSCFEFGTAVHDTRIVFHCTNITLWLMARVGDAEGMAQLLGAQRALLQRTGFAPSTWSQARSADAASAIRSRLTPDAFEAALTAGRMLSDDNISALAIEVLTSRPQVTNTLQPQVKEGSKSILSARELEVLELVAEGLTSKQIGQQLFLSPRTVNHHLYTVFNKLGVDSRAQAVAVAARAGFL
jgi:predicted ATPase/DNA-binding CsgD family transcriptional regulator